jgi:hypothetical protein
VGVATGAAKGVATVTGVKIFKKFAGYGPHLWEGVVGEERKRSSKPQAGTKKIYERKFDVKWEDGTSTDMKESTILKCIEQAAKQSTRDQLAQQRPRWGRRMAHRLILLL